MAKLTAHARTTNQSRRIRDMQGRLGHRGDAGKGLAVVAVGTTADDAGVLHYPSGKSAGTGISCRVAGLACRTGRQVVHRLGDRRHAGKDLAVVASRATADDARVVHFPRVIGGAMAERAHRSRRQVIGRLGAASRNRKARCRAVAALARRGARRTVGRGHCLRHRSHTGKGYAHVLKTMAGRTTTEDTRVRHQRSGKSTRIGFTCRVAGLARRIGRQMV